MIELNCTGTVQLAKHLVRHMRQLNARKILFTASIAGEMVAPHEAVYAATKAFVLSFAHSLRYELRGTGITITALQPGPTDTDFFHRAAIRMTSQKTASRLCSPATTTSTHIQCRPSWKAQLRTLCQVPSRRPCTRRWPNLRAMNKTGLFR
jgi:short-subunit dehydrogenase